MTWDVISHTRPPSVCSLFENVTCVDNSYVHTSCFHKHWRGTTQGNLSRSISPCATPFLAPLPSPGNQSPTLAATPPNISPLCPSFRKKSKGIHIQGINTAHHPPPTLQEPQPRTHVRYLQLMRWRLSIPACIRSSKLKPTPNPPPPLPA